MSGKIQIIEEALLNSMPALETELLDGWLLRLNKNYTYRANCVCPVYYNENRSTAEKIKMCEGLLYRNRQPSVLKVTPTLQNGLSEILVSMGYQNVKTVNVMCCIIQNTSYSCDYPLQLSETPDTEWLDASAALSGLTEPGLIRIHCLNLKSIAVKSVFVKAEIDGKIIGCGYIGIYGLHVDDRYRCRGIGTSICRAVINYGIRNGEQSAYLIVHNKNRNAISLYSHMGFTDLYNYSFYQKNRSSCQITDG